MSQTSRNSHVRVPSEGDIDPPQIPQHNKVVLSSSSTSRGINRNFSVRRETQQQPCVSRNERALPRFDSLHFLTSHATMVTSRRSRVRHHGTSSQKRPFSAREDRDMSSVDSFFLQATANLSGPDSIPGASPPPSFYDIYDFRYPLGLAPPAPSEIVQEQYEAPTSKEASLLDLCKVAGLVNMDRESFTEEEYTEHDLSWNQVRNWLQLHSAQDLFLAMECRDDRGRTAIHCACQHKPPLDVVAFIIQHCPQSLQSTDVFDWLPLHYACAFSAAPVVVQQIAETYKEAKVAFTNRGLTPLHVALIGPLRNFGDMITSLASSGASQMADNDGILPLHYASAFGASAEVVRALVTSFPESLFLRDKHGRDPLMYALANTKTNPKAAPKIVTLLLNLISIYTPRSNNNICNTTSTDLTALDFLANVASEIETNDTTKEIGASMKECLLLLLEAEVYPTATLLSTLRTLPHWLLPTAILSPKVQMILDDKCNGRLPTIILMVDLYMQLINLTIFNTGIVSESSEKRQRYAIALMGTGCYFLARELIEVVTLIRIGSFRTFLRVWLLHISDWLDLLYVGAVGFCGYIIYIDEELDGAQRTMVAICSGVLWAKLFLYLRSMSIDFSVFVSGLLYVSGSLTPYLICLLIFLIGFSQMFQTIFRNSPDYDCTEVDKMSPLQAQRYYERNDTARLLMVESLQCGYEDEFMPFCNRWKSFLHVYTMFLGEINEDEFTGSIEGTLLYVFFVFLMVILLANVLIAIVTSSYKFIQDNDAALVFYTDRLYFLAETDAIGNFSFFQSYSGCSKQFDDRTRDIWDNLLLILEEDSRDPIPPVGCWSLRVFNKLTTIIAIPTWFILGLCTCGAAWPPQIRKRLFTSNVSRRYSTAQAEQQERQYCLEAAKQVATEIDLTRNEFFQHLSENRQYHAHIKASIMARKNDVRGEMKQIHVLMANLFEQIGQLKEDLVANESGSNSEGYLV